ncbi:hypothetical protein ACFVG1_28740 [Streptomyces bacillaris]|uniref:hypothetical protein n=1 Tax=Streptomyces bacillaris TaxID=68179 RepID=UPI0035DE405C
MPDTVRLNVLDARFVHGSFPADELLAGCFDLVETSAFGGFAAKRDLLRDLCELALEQPGSRRVSPRDGAQPFVTHSLFDLVA